MASTEAEPVIEAVDSDNMGLDVARAILWAAENISTARITKRQAGSALRYAYWQYGRKERTKLLVDLVPKALSIIDKNKTPAEDANIEAAERKAFKELEMFLDSAVEEFEKEVREKPVAGNS